MSNHDLDWLAAQQPQRSGADRDAHDRALLSLLRHASSHPAGRRRGPKLGRLRFAGLVNTRVLAVATAGGAAAIATAVVLSANTGTVAPTVGQGSGGSASQGAVAHHAQPSLARLADDVGASPAPTGDATLVQRTTHTGGQDVTVYDLYGDNNQYYFSRDESGLAAQVSGDHSQGAGVFGREVAAAREAATGNVQQAGMDMAKAPAPNSSIDPNQAVDWAAEKAKLNVLIKAGDKNAAAQLAAGPSAAGTLYDNWAWEDSQDALIAGAGDPQVRAGVLKILATLPGVTVTQVTVGGQPALSLSSGPKETGVGYTETLTINAETGMPIGFVGGKTNSPAGTRVDYQVARVNLSDVAAGRLPSF